MQYGQLLDLASTNTSVAALHSRGMGVYFVGVGKADVTYSEKVWIDRTNYCTTDHTIHYTVVKGDPTATSQTAAGVPITEDRIVVYGNSGSGSSEEGGGGAAGGGADGGVSTGGGDTGGSYSYTTPTLSITTKSFNGMGFDDVPVTTGITYNSSNPAVATIDANGVVTVTGVIGETTISATWAGDANWNAATASYVLHAKKQPTMYFSPYQATDTVGNVMHLAPVIGTPGVTVDAWESNRPEVATVDNNGNVTMLHFGTAWIDAIYNGNAEYHSARCRFYLTVSKKKPHISFTPSVVQYELYTPFVAPTLNKPEDITDNYTWRSNNTNVATVSDNGDVLFEGATGYTQIQCFFQGDDNYLKDTARYDLTVTTSGIIVMGTYVTTANDGDVFGDGSVIYTVEPNTGQKYITLHKDTFDANGGVFIESNSFLSIRVDGNCVINNAVKAIEASSGIFIWCQNRKDTITVNATYSAISAAEMKIHDCYLFANGGQYGLLNNSGPITVSAGGYVFAQGGTEAIRARMFTKGEDNIGGIEILTKGVEFVSWEQASDNFGGFYSNYAAGTKATFVELGKVPLPVSENEVTDIAFNGEGNNPDENLDVVFSSSDKDTFNETEGQIEINTTTDDETLTNTLTAYVTCSSEWLKLLPGVLVFDVPAGEGKFELSCQIAEGFHVEAQIEGVGKAVVAQTAPGKIEVQYNVVKQTHVIIYLQEDKTANPAPARMTQAKKDAAPAMAVKAIKIVPKNAATGLDTLQPTQHDGTVKFLRNGRIYILRGDKIYTLTGQEIK